MKTLVTGAAGFIGSQLVDRLLADGHEVTGVDCFRTGHRENLPRHQPGFRLLETDLRDPAALATALTPETVVFHLAANADVRRGPEHPLLDLELNTVVTANVLESMRKADVKEIVFTSTGSVYGEPTIFPTPETCPFPTQTSLYAASKLAGEAFISAFCEAYGMRGTVLRLVSVLGPRYSHGHVADFVRMLRADPSKLRILGDGKQRKAYVHVADCVEGMLQARTRDHRFAAFNLGADETISVDESASLIAEELGVDPKVEHAGGPRGWVGDSPLIHLDCAKLRRAGWAPRHGIRDSIRETARWVDGR